MDHSFGNPDVIVVGAGNAASCAALAAREQGASVIMLEAAPLEDCGGNSRYTAGAMRVVFNGVDDLLQLVPDLSAEEIANSDFGSYSREQYLDDMGRLTQYRTDPDLAELLVDRSFATLARNRRSLAKYSMESLRGLTEDALSKRRKYRQGISTMLSPASQARVMISVSQNHPVSRHRLSKGRTFSRRKNLHPDSVSVRP